MVEYWILLQKERKAKGISAADMAERIGVNVKTYSRIELGKGSFEQTKKLATELGFVIMMLRPGDLHTI